MEETNPPALHPRAVALRKAIALGSREPFQVALADGLAHAPSNDAWEAFAERSPDKWAASIRSLGELSGYTIRSGADTADVLHELANLVEVLDKRSGAPQTPVLDAVIVEPTQAPSVAQLAVCEPVEPAPAPAPLGADGWP